MKKTTANEFTKELYPVFISFYKRYQSKWQKNGSDGMEIMKYWGQEFEKNSVQINVIKDVAEQVLTMPRYKDFPPGVVDFIELCKKNEKKQINDELETDNSVESAFLAIYKEIGLIYKGLWDKDGTFGDTEQYQFWLKEIKNEKLSIETIQKTYKKLGNLESIDLILLI